MNLNTALASQIWDQISRFARNLFSDLSSGWLLFGTPADLILMVIDVLVTTLAVYFILKLMADTRAWQLFKGIIFILVFTFVCDLIGLQTINYVLANSLSVLAIGFVVIFQPELRRALETVGRRSLRIFNTAVLPEQNEETRFVHNIIESIVIACEHMAATYTGALIVLERQTKLGELISGTAVVLDSSLTSTMLEQIFYNGSPLHDGAVIIRDDRIYAARVHIPLSDNYHLRTNYGTRHRAAVGVSEIGDAIGIVVSEERGRISVTMAGRLYPIENGDALRALLHKILSPVQTEKRAKSTIRSVIMNVVQEPEDAVAGVDEAVTKATMPRKTKLFLRLASVAIAVVLWFYVQINQNPVRTVTIGNIPIQVTNAEEIMADHDVIYSRADSTVTIRFQVRQKYYDMISRENVIAQVDFKDLDVERMNEDISTLGQSIQKLEVNVTIEDLSANAYAVVTREPSEQSVVLAPASVTAD